MLGRHKKEDTGFSPCPPFFISDTHRLIVAMIFRVNELQIVVRKNGLRKLISKL